MKLNLGCGLKTMYGWVNVDRERLPGVDVVTDLNDKLPFEDNSGEEFLLSHVLEHINKPLDLMQELHRIAKPDARLTVAVPYGSSDDAWEDPTHVRPYFLGSFEYFGQPFYWRADYGFRGDWRTDEIVLVVDAGLKGKEAEAIMAAVRRERNIVHEMIAQLSAVKPIREPLRELQTPQKITVLFK